MKRYGLLGRTLKHSFSQGYFTKKIAEQGINDAVYQNFEIATIEELPQLLRSYPDLKGLNVTIPYKEHVLAYLAEKTALVQAIGACNCIKIEDGKLTGYNTDAVGFRKSLEPQLKPHHKKALVFGTGGASKAVTFVLQELGIEHRLVSRKKTAGQVDYDDITEDVISEYHLLVNTTPLGMYPAVDVAPPIPFDFVTPKHFLFDLIYNPAKTKFLGEGEKRGAQICNGHQMLIEQAEESWRIWEL